MSIMKRNQRAEPKIFAYLNGARGDVAVMGKTRSEGRSVVESELWFALRQFQLLVKSVDFCPVCEDFFLFGWEVWLFGH